VRSLQFTSAPLVVVLQKEVLMTIIVPPMPAPIAVTVTMCSACDHAVSWPAHLEVADALRCDCPTFPSKVYRRLWVRATMRPPVQRVDMFDILDYWIDREAVLS